MNLRLNRKFAGGMAILACQLSLAASLGAAPRLQFLWTPNEGIQPQAALDSGGVVHLIYFKGDPQAGDIFYVRQDPEDRSFSEAIRVNTQPGSAIAIGTIRGAQLSVGKSGRVHVVWNGSHRAKAAAHEGAPMFYTRLNDSGSAFEPERDLITYAAGLDGGGSVAADPQGRVYVTWHAPRPGNQDGEAGRAVFIARSSDEGKTFSREEQANPKPTGACGCCGMRAFADSQGAVYVLYRSASEKVNRDEILLASRNRGQDFEIAHSHPWNVPTCPMSSATITQTKDRVLAAWETAGQVYFTTINPKTFAVSKPVAPPGLMTRKHPVVVGNTQGEILLVWTEGTGWQKGGTVAWQLFDQDGNALPEKGRGGTVKVWSLVSAFAKPDGSFVVVY